jgi:hypothetical protein
MVDIQIRKTEAPNGGKRKSILGVLARGQPGEGELICDGDDELQAAASLKG